MKKNIYRITYIIGITKLAFHKRFAIPPVNGLVLTDKAEDCVIEEALVNTEDRTVSIFNNVLFERYEVEIAQRVNIETVSKEKIERWVSNYKKCGWICDTIKQDISDLIEKINH